MRYDIYTSLGAKMLCTGIATEDYQHKMHENEQKYNKFWATSDEELAVV